MFFKLSFFSLFLMDGYMDATVQRMMCGFGDDPNVSVAVCKHWSPHSLTVKWMVWTEVGFSKRFKFHKITKITVIYIKRRKPSFLVVNRSHNPRSRLQIPILAPNTNATLDRAASIHHACAPTHRHLKVVAYNNCHHPNKNKFSTCFSLESNVFMSKPQATATTVWARNCTGLLCGLLLRATEVDRYCDHCKIILIRKIYKQLHVWCVFRPENNSWG